MNFGTKLRSLLFAMALIFCLSACGASQPQTSGNDGVQDINPGERSVIQPPARQAPASNIGERSL